MTLGASVERSSRTHIFAVPEKNACNDGSKALSARQTAFASGWWLKTSNSNELGGAEDSMRNRHHAITS